MVQEGPTNLKATELGALSKLSAEHLAAVEDAKRTYLALGGTVDEYSLPFFVRFCVGNGWNKKSTDAHLAKVYKWRKAKGCDGIRRKILDGLKVSSS